MTALVASACGLDPVELPPGDFVGDNPFGGGGGDDGETGAAGDGNGDAGDEGGGDDPGREIAEADIVHVDGDRLYALSQFGGLSVIDVSDPDDLKILGRYQAHASPFEMYIDGGQVFVMYTDYGRYVWDEAAGGYSWQTSSNLVALDASDPSNITAAAEFELPGRIQDSRRVGDVLYLVTHEDGYCWGCNAERNTVVSSLDVSDPTSVNKVDELRFVADPDSELWGWNGQRSVSATDERMYIAGIEADRDDWEKSHSTIDVIDISDPGGSLAKGGTVEVAGQITNRWQMDEHEGVLRVISQPGVWGGDKPPVVETFTVASADSLTPLGSTALTLPRPEALRAVRFAGDRGYAITFERVDPLFTIDLSDPSDPKQAGELEIPGWVHHMEPRGDRLLGLGFDPGNPEGSINVSLFDVAELDSPTMLSRVHFGGDWASFAEDQNRIHKAFTILDDLGLLLIPFAGWEWDGADECNGTYRSAIQLVDFTDEALVRRGQAPARGVARRALLHRDRLVAMSDKSLESFDIEDRDAPQSTSRIALATNVSKVGVGDGIVARLSQDWWSDETLLEVVGVDDPGALRPLGTLNLREVLDGRSNVEGCWYWGLWSAELLVQGSHAYLLREQWDDVGSKATALLDVFDLSDPTAPAFVRTVSVDAQLGWGGGGVVALEERRVVVTVSAIVLSTHDAYGYGDEEPAEASIVVLDISDPSDPQLRPALPRPDALAHGDLQVQDGRLVSWHMAAVDGDPSRVRFYLDRIEVGDSTAPELLPPVNVPGVVAGYDASARRAVTVDFQLEERMVADESECFSDPRVHDYDYDAKRCRLARRRLNLVELLDGGAAGLLGQLDVEGNDSALRAVSVTPERVFARLSRGSWGWGGGVVESDDGGGPLAVPTDRISVLPDWTSDALSVASTTDVGIGGWWLGPLRGEQTAVVFNAENGVGVLDAADASSPTTVVHDLVGYGCWDMHVVGGRVLCPQGEFGLQVIPLPN